MNSILLGIILIAGPLRAQPVGNCAVAQCPGNYLPAPTPLSTNNARKIVQDAISAIKATESIEKVAEGELEKRFDELKASLAKSIPWHKPWTVIDDAAVRTAALSDQKYLRLQEDLRSAVAQNYKAHNDAIVAVAREYQLLPPIMDFNGDPRAAGVNMVAGRGCRVIAGTKNETT